jgi:pimeloyl-ACP methyl ester carboxylesterase
MTSPSHLKLKGGGTLAYHKTAGSAPGIVFLGGFRSDMTGVKAVALEAFCKERGQAFLRFDYRGHGQSSGDFAECGIGTWADDALEAITRLTKGPQILVGSSMGGWLALLVAIEKPRRVAGIIGIAAAADFTEHLMWEKLTPRQQEEVMRKGSVMVPSDMGPPYPITKRLIEEGRRYLLLGAEIPVFCPVRLLHGMKDEDVPWEVSLAINEKIAGKDVKTILIDEGDHRLSTPKDIEKLLSVTAKMLDGIMGLSDKKSAGGRKVSLSG